MDGGRMQEHLHVGRAGAPIPIAHQLLSCAGRAAGRDQPVSSLHRHSGGSWAEGWECRGCGGGSCCGETTLTCALEVT